MEIFTFTTYYIIKCIISKPKILIFFGNNNFAVDVFASEIFFNDVLFNIILVWILFLFIFSFNCIWSSCPLPSSASSSSEVIEIWVALLHNVWGQKQYSMSFAILQSLIASSLHDFNVFSPLKLKIKLIYTCLIINLIYHSDLTF